MTETTNDHVLSHLARRFAVSEENVATEALTWILTKSAAARASLAGMLSGTGVLLPDTLSYVGQVSQIDSGRPDIIGHDDEHRERLIVEAKFAAKLTEQQPLGYLSRLPPDVDGALLVVAPSVRLPSLWSELLRELPEGRTTAPAPTAVRPTDGLLQHQLNANHVMALVSWRQLTDTVTTALTTAGELHLLSDAQQLTGLTEDMDRSAYAVVRPDDYGQHVARQVRQLEELIDGTRTAVKNNALLEHAGNSSHGRVFYGWYLASRKTGKHVWFGFWPRAWDRWGQSPLWMQVRVHDRWTRHVLERALAGYNQPGQRGLYDLQDSFAVPLVIPVHVGEQEVVADLVHQLEQLMLALDRVAAPDEPRAVEPTEDDLEQADGTPEPL